MLSNLRLFLMEEEKRLLEADILYRQRRMQVQQQQLQSVTDAPSTTTTQTGPPPPQERYDLKEMGDIQSGYLTRCLPFVKFRRELRKLVLLLFLYAD